jgi:hypothetical protein
VSEKLREVQELMERPFSDPDFLLSPMIIHNEKVTRLTYLKTRGELREVESLKSNFIEERKKYLNLSFFKLADEFLGYEKILSQHIRHKTLILNEDYFKDTLTSAIYLEFKLDFFRHKSFGYVHNLINLNDKYESFVIKRGDNAKIHYLIHLLKQDLEKRQEEAFVANWLEDFLKCLGIAMKNYKKNKKRKAPSKKNDDELCEFITRANKVFSERILTS